MGIMGSMGSMGIMGVMDIMDHGGCDGWLPAVRNSESEVSYWMV